MYLQRTTGLANGHVLPQRRYEHSLPHVSSTTTAHLRQRNNVSSRVSLYSRENGASTALSVEAPSSPVARSASATSGSSSKASSSGVFLSNCKVSADFIQLRTDVPVRLYLTASELVKKTSSTHSSRKNGSTFRSTDHDSSKDFTISRYPLQDIDVSSSKVSPDTMMVTLKSSTRREGATEDGKVTSSNTPGGVNCKCRDSDPRTGKYTRFPSPYQECPLDTTASTTTTTTTKFSSTVSSSNHSNAQSNEYFTGVELTRGGVISVEAYQLAPGQEGSIQDWICRVEKNKQKLPLIGKLKQDSANSGAKYNQVPARHSLTRPNSIALPHTDKCSVVSHRKTGTQDLYRQSQSSYDFPSGSSTREKLTAANGRYTPLHHHYSPHPLFSNSPSTHSRSTMASVPLRHSERDSFKLFRRLSLGGTYRFPSSPTAKSPTTRGKALDQGHDGKTTAGGTSTYPHEHDVDQTDSLHQPVPSENSPFSPPAAEVPSPVQRDPQSRSSHRDILRRKHRPNFFRSMSEYHDSDSEAGVESRGSTIESQGSLIESRVPSIAKHQMSDPIPVNNTNGVETNVPAELKDLQALIKTLPSPSSHSPSHTPPSLPTPSPLSDEDTGFQSFLRHKQIRGKKIHISPRAHSTSVSTDHLSPPSSTVNHTPSNKLTQRTSSTLPRSHKLKTGQVPRQVESEGTYDVKYIPSTDWNYCLDIQTFLRFHLPVQYVHLYTVCMYTFHQNGHFYSLCFPRTISLGMHHSTVCADPPIAPIVVLCRICSLHVKTL